MLSLNSGPITGQDWCLLTNKSAAIVLCMYMASIIDNFAINTVGSRQKLQFISKQKQFSDRKCLHFRHAHKGIIVKQRRRRGNCGE